MQSRVDEVLEDGALPTPPRVRAAILREWDRLSGPGATLDAEQRAMAASAAREAAARGRGLDSPSAPLTRIAGWVMTDAGGIDRTFIEELEADGFSRFQVAEVIAVVSRLSAIDHYTNGIGTGLIPLPTPFSGPPTGRFHADAFVGPAWIPTAPGRISAPTVLGALPDEAWAVMDLHGELYLTEREMGTNEFDRALTRTEMEFIAARTSFLNECFY